MLVGPRSVTSFDEGLRYSLAPGFCFLRREGVEPPKYTERWGELTFASALSNDRSDHEVKFNISLRAAADCYVATSASAQTVSISNASLYVDYIYLDTDERRQFAQVQHEYLIEQLQFTGAESFANSSVKSKLSFNHPCKELVWVVQPDANLAGAGKDLSNYSDAGAQTVADAKLQLNGHDRFSTRKGSYFNLVQPFQHHTRIPEAGIYVYSFALNPEQHQPSGTVNMSRIDNATLLLNLATGSSAVKLRVYAVNYNILRVMAGINPPVPNSQLLVEFPELTQQGKQCNFRDNWIC